MLPLASFPLSAASLLDALSSILSNMLPTKQTKKKRRRNFSWEQRWGGGKHHIHESLMPQFYRGKSSNTVKVRDSIINAIKCMDLCCWRLFREFLQNILYKKYIYLQVFCGNITRFCELIICEVYRLDRSQNRTEKCSVICGKGQDSVYIHSIFSETCFSI